MTSSTEYLSVRIGDQEFLVPLADIRAVMPLSNFTPASHPNALLIGTVKSGQWISPVVNLRENLRATGPPGRRQVIVLMQMHREEGPRWLGLLVDYAGRSVRINCRDFREGAIRISGRMNRLLELDERFSPVELRALAAHREAPLAKAH